MGHERERQGQRGYVMVDVARKLLLNDRRSADCRLKRHPNEKKLKRRHGWFRCMVRRRAERNGQENNEEFESIEKIRGKNIATASRQIRFHRAKFKIPTACRLPPLCKFWCKPSELFKQRKCRSFLRSIHTELWSTTCLSWSVCQNAVQLRSWLCFLVGSVDFLEALVTRPPHKK